MGRGVGGGNEGSIRVRVSGFGFRGLARKAAGPVVVVVGVRTG